MSSPSHPHPAHLQTLALLIAGLAQTACAQTGPYPAAVSQPDGTVVEYVPVLNKTPIVQNVSVPREYCQNEPSSGFYRNSFKDSDRPEAPQQSDEPGPGAWRGGFLKTSFGDKIKEIKRQGEAEQGDRNQRPPRPPAPRDEYRDGRDRDRDRGRDHGHDRGRDPRWGYDRPRYDTPRTIIVPVPTPQYGVPRYITPPVYVAPAPIYQAPIYQTPIYQAPVYTEPSYVRRCYTRNEWVSQTTGYEIVYQYQGQRYRGQVNADPGNFVALKQGYFPGDPTPSVFPEGATQRPTLVF